MKSEKLSQQISGEAQTAESHEAMRDIPIGKKTLVLLVGLPGSGKSTFAETHFPHDAIVSTDRLREQLSNNIQNQLVTQKAWQIARRMVEERLKHGEITVLDAQNLIEGDRAQFYEIAKSAGARVEAIFLNVPPEKSIERDKGRTKKVGAEYIKSRKTVFSSARHLLEGNEHIDALHIIEPDEAEHISVVLPDDDRESLEADKELGREAARAETIMGAVEAKFLTDAGSHDELPVKAGSVLFVENAGGEQTKEFWSANFLPHQIVDAESIARRLHTDVTDRAVFDVMQMILRERIYLNLTSAVSYPKNFPYADDLRSITHSLARKRNIEIPTPTLRIAAGETSDPAEMPEADDDIPLHLTHLSESAAAAYRIRVTRDAPEDAPLLLVGDIQGTYTAMRELSGRVRKENIATEKTADNGSKRMIVFVGDMADRGPYDAESVIYITSLVRSGRAILVKGNHDENLLNGLKGEHVQSEETRNTVADLIRRLKPDSIAKIMDMIEKAPRYAEWQHLVAVHASLPRIPRAGEEITHQEEHTMTHGTRSGRFVGGRLEVWKLPNTVAHDPDMLIVGGHTHEESPVHDMLAGATILDAGAEQQGELWGMFYPELEFVSAKEPNVIKLFEILKGTELPQGEALLTFIEYARQQGLINVKRGSGEYEGLILASYSDITEASDMWEKYPVLRNFRGLILDTDGNIVARPFKKTHKAGQEVALDTLDVIPDNVFEKANGSLGILYFWKGEWRAATKFSFENDDYTKPMMEMLASKNKEALDPAKTHLFEIILPNDSHIVDYGGRRELIFLNSIDAATGETDAWESVARTAEALGVRTARDMTGDFPGMTIAEIYRFAQTEGNLQNLEGVMARYHDADGEDILVKVKVREYDDKKFVRDRLDWERIIKAFDPKTMAVPAQKKEELLSYNFDNAFARAALEARIQWIRDVYERVVADTRQFVFGPHSIALAEYERLIASGMEKRKAIDSAVRHAVPHLQKILEEDRGEAKSGDMRTFMGFLRDMLSDTNTPEERLAIYALKKAQETVESETKKRGKNSFWMIPQ